LKTEKLTKQESLDIIKAIDCKHTRLLFETGIVTGLRISELLSLKGASLKNDCIHIQKSATKGKVSARTIPVPKSLMDKLYSRAEEYGHGLIFPINRINAYDRIKKACKKVGITKRIGTHGMRKTFAHSVYDISGRDLRLTQLALGHKSVSSTIHYLEIDSEHLNNTILAVQTALTAEYPAR
jgi:integrase